MLSKAIERPNMELYIEEAFLSGVRNQISYCRVRTLDQSTAKHIELAATRHGQRVLTLRGSRVLSEDTFLAPDLAPDAAGPRGTSWFRYGSLADLTRVSVLPLRVDVPSCPCDPQSLVER